MSQTIVPVGHVDPMTAAKWARAEQVAAIVVTTAAGRAFNGDETSQNRMSRAVTAMGDADLVPWVLASNALDNVSRAELQEALRLSGAAMAALWIKPYQQGE